MTEPREGEAVTIRTTRIPESLIPWDAPRECVIDTPCKHCGRVRWEISINPWTGLCHKCESKYEVMVAEAELQASVFEVASVTWCGKYHDAGGKEAGND